MRLLEVAAKRKAASARSVHPRPVALMAVNAVAANKYRDSGCFFVAK
jgi:hypothetical protein